MFSTMFSRKAATRLFVHAFNTGRSRSFLSREIPLRLRNSPPRWLATHGVARVDEDLDAALDNLLGSAFDEAEDPVDLNDETRVKDEAHTKDSQPISNTLVEKVSDRPLCGPILIVKKLDAFFSAVIFFGQLNLQPNYINEQLLILI
jgi:hypothetical protein